MPTIKLIQLNVEIDRHWDTIIPFLEREIADVICLQEIFERDAAVLASALGYNYIHIPITKKVYDKQHNATDPIGAEGPALFSKTPFTSKGREYYFEAASEIQFQTIDKRATMHEGVVWGTTEKDGAAFTIASTHFTWTPHGQPSEHQDQDIVSLLKILSNIPELILCGDFNAPRGEGNRIYKKLIERFKDNIPPDIKTSLDFAYHRARNNSIERKAMEGYMVDYIFSTPRYVVSDVRQEFGLSDHSGFVANISVA